MLSLRAKTLEARDAAAKKLEMANESTARAESTANFLLTQRRLLEEQMFEQMREMQRLEATFKDREIWLLAQIHELEHAMVSSAEVKSHLAMRRIGKFLVSVLRERRLRRKLKRINAASRIQGAWHRYLRRKLASDLLKMELSTRRVHVDIPLSDGIFPTGQGGDKNRPRHPARPERPPAD